MSLNDSGMLPKHIRRMRQMNEVLDAEDIILAEIEKIIDEMYDRASLLHEELVNEEWLKEKLDARTGADTKVINDAEHLLTTFIFKVGDSLGIRVKDVNQFIDKWLPAHLMYKLIMLLEIEFVSAERFTMDQMSLGFEYVFWDINTLNGLWLLDGSVLLDATRGNGECGLGYDMGDIELQEEFKVSLEAGAAVNLKESMETERVDIGFESHFWKARLLDGTWNMDGTVPLEQLRQYQEYGLVFGLGDMRTSEQIDAGVTVIKDYWLLDGNVNLSGKRKLDAEKREEEL